MKNNTKISKYIKLSLISNFVFLDNFAGCKNGNKKGYSGKKQKGEDNNNKHTEQQSNENENKKPENPEGNKPPITKDYTKEKNEFTAKLNDIDTKNKFLPDKSITLDKPTLEDKINKIKTDEQVNDINIKLRRLESQLTNALTNLKQDYISRLNEIINGNSKLGFGITISLNEETIKNLDFGENIKNIKTVLDALEKEYFKQLGIKCNYLKTTYDNLKTEIKKITNKTQREAAESFCSNLTDDSFENIKKYETYEQLSQKITQIQHVINDNIDKLKVDFKTVYKNYETIATNLGLTITSLNVDLLKKIEKLSMASIQYVKSTLDNIKKQIENGINNLNEDFKQKYGEIKGKIEHLKNNIEFDYTEINTNITKDTNLENLQKSINNLKTKLTTTIENLKTKYTTEITNLNKNFKDLSIEESIKLKILDGLSYDKLNDKTISNIEDSIKAANEKCNKKIDTYQTECKSKLDEAKKTNEDILNIGEISNLINDINDAINNIKTTENKNDVDTLLKNLTTKINGKEEEKKKEEEEAKKKKEEKEEEEKKKEEEKVKEVLDNFKKGVSINNVYNLYIYLEDNKYKLYHVNDEKKQFICESNKNVTEANIKDINDYKNSTYTIILKFRGRKEFKISDQKIDDVINNFVKLIESSIKGYYEKTKHFFLNLNITFNNEPYTEIYDFNTGNLINRVDTCGKIILLGRCVDEKKLRFAGNLVGYSLKDDESCQLTNNGNWNYNKNGKFEEVADVIKPEFFYLMTKVELKNN